jgi:hypothetical protein
MLEHDFMWIVRDSAMTGEKAFGLLPPIVM